MSINRVKGAFPDPSVSPEGEDFHGRTLPVAMKVIKTSAPSFSHGDISPDCVYAKIVDKISGINAAEWIFEILGEGDSCSCIGIKLLMLGMIRAGTGRITVVNYDVWNSPLLGHLDE
jgi:hypothetical protein